MTARLPSKTSASSIQPTETPIDFLYRNFLKKAAIHAMIDGLLELRKKSQCDVNESLRPSSLELGVPVQSASKVLARKVVAYLRIVDLRHR